MTADARRAAVRKSVASAALDAGLSMAALCRTWGVSKQALSSYLSGRGGSSTSTPMAKRIRDLGIDVCLCGRVECPGGDRCRKVCRG